MFYLYLILIYILNISYCYVSYKCCTAIQETRIPSEMCVGETCITDGKHASLVICVCGEACIPRDTCSGNILPGETCIPMTSEVLHNICNMCCQDLPDMSALNLGPCAPSGSCVYIRQIPPAHVIYITYTIYCNIKTTLIWR